MKLSRLTLLLMMLLILSCTSSTNPLTRQQVDGVIAKWLTLWDSYDVGMLDAIFWNDPQMTYFSSEKRGLIKGFDKMKPHHESFGFVEGGKTHAKKLWLEDIDITMHNNFAAVGATWYFGDESIPKDSVQNGPVTFVIIKDSKGEPRIAHTHFANY